MNHYGAKPGFQPHLSQELSLRVWWLVPCGVKPAYWFLHQSPAQSKTSGWKVVRNQLLPFVIACREGGCWPKAFLKVVSAA